MPVVAKVDPLPAPMAPVSPAVAQHPVEIRRDKPANVNVEAAKATPAIPAATPQPSKATAAHAPSSTHFVEPDLPIHEAAELFPELTGPEYDAVKKDIKEKGQQVPACRARPISPA